MRVTIKDIAKEANVSHTTVSRALRDSPLIGDNTKKRIKKIADEMNYVPNMSAKSLANVKSYNIGVFFSSLSVGTSSDFVFTMIRGISKKIPDEYTLIFNGLDKMGNKNRIVSGNFDGVILISLCESDDKFIAQVNEEHIPLVVLNREITDKNVSCLYCDEKTGIKEAVCYLSERGHKSIGFVKGIESSASSKRRLNGFIDGIRICSLDQDQCPITSGDYTAKSGYPATKQLLAINPNVTAIIYTSETMAYGAMRALAEDGLKVPDDVSVIGFDDGDLANNMYPPLTSVGRPLDEMAEKGAEFLMKMILSGKSEPLKFCYPVHLAVKESVRSIK